MCNVVGSLVRSIILCLGDALLTAVVIVSHQRWNRAMGIFKLLYCSLFSSFRTLGARGTSNLKKVPGGSRCKLVWIRTPSILWEIFKDACRKIKNQCSPFYRLSVTMVRTEKTFFHDLFTSEVLASMAIVLSPFYRARSVLTYVVLIPIRETHSPSPNILFSKKCRKTSTVSTQRFAKIDIFPQIPRHNQLTVLKKVFLFVLKKFG